MCLFGRMRAGRSHLSYLSVPKFVDGTNVDQIETPALVYETFSVRHSHRGIDLVEKEVTFQFKAREDLNLVDLIDKMNKVIWASGTNKRVSPWLKEETKGWKLEKTLTEEVNSSRYTHNDSDKFRCKYLRHGCPVLFYITEPRTIGVKFRICFSSMQIEGNTLPEGGFFLFEVGAYLVMKHELICLVDYINKCHIVTSSDLLVVDKQWNQMKADFNRLMNVPQYARAVNHFLYITKYGMERNKGYDIAFALLCINCGLCAFVLWRWQQCS